MVTRAMLIRAYQVERERYKLLREQGEAMFAAMKARFDQ